MAGSPDAPATLGHGNIVDRKPSGQGPYHNVLVTEDGATGFRVYSNFPPPVTQEAWRQQEATAERAKALYERGGPVAGHDFAQEWRERTGEDQGR